MRNISRILNEIRCELKAPASCFNSETRASIPLPRGRSPSRADCSFELAVECRKPSVNHGLLVYKVLEEVVDTKKRFKKLGRVH